MPKYVYKCTGCEELFEVYHGMNESQESCIFCSSKGLNRVPQMTFHKVSVEPKGDKVGDRVEAAIEENRGLLKEMKKERDYYRDDN